MVTILAIKHECVNYAYKTASDDYQYPTQLLNDFRRRCDRECKVINMNYIESSKVLRIFRSFFTSGNWFIGNRQPASFCFIVLQIFEWYEFLYVIWILYYNEFSELFVLKATIYIRYFIKGETSIENTAYVSNTRTNPVLNL